MLDKHERGEKIGTVRQTLGRISDEDNPTSSYINLSNLDVENKEEYFFEVKSVGSGVNIDGDVTFVGTIHKDNNSVTLPRDIIEDQDLLPGHTIGVNVFELETVEVNNQKTFQNSGTGGVEDSNQNSVTDRAEVWADKTSPDGVDSKISSEVIYNAIDGESLVEFTNLRNDKSTKNLTKPLSRDGDLSFKKNIRSQINAKPNDVIELSVAKGTDGENNENSTEGETLKEIHEMLEELYNAYKND